ncbi:hypothetical protein BDP27DRAFT_1429870 [Rhodocollybia butyracea]|uniref:Cytochrome b561 domain-containing protein n=1 Tax=Rhodocollybia butyracea TaxID=206335 RepID=A0A9P5PEB6_9AGAR|nr:hypothetical protein BDP27DRAFT_1429870 [Rhodocollybia butyracea]
MPESPSSGATPDTPTLGSAERAHGVMIVPASAILTRYLRRLPSSGPKLWFFPVHLLLNVLALAFFLVGFTIAIFISGDEQFQSAHKRIGLALAILFLLQALGGLTIAMIHHRYPTQRRDHPLIDRPHWLLGWVILLLGFANIPVGLYISGGTNSYVYSKSLSPSNANHPRHLPLIDGFQTSKTVHILAFVWIGALCIGIAAMEGMYRWSSRHGNENWRNPAGEDNLQEGKPMNRNSVGNGTVGTGGRTIE